MKPCLPLALLLIPAACGSFGPTRIVPVAASIAADDSTTLVYDVCGRGPAILFVHGWACNRHFWRAQQQEFATDHTVITVDLAGHGDSTTTRSEFSVGRLGRDVAMLVKKLDLERVVLVGHSLGGPVCLAAVSELKGRVQLVVGIDCLHDVELRLTAAMMQPMLQGFEQDCEGRMTDAVQSAFPAGTDQRPKAFVLDAALQTPAATVVGVLRGYVGLDQAALLERAKVPVRCINAAARPPDGQETRIEQNRKHGDFDAVLVEGTGHFVMLQAPDQVNVQLRKWLGEFAAGR